MNVYVISVGMRNVAMSYYLKTEPDSLYNYMCVFFLNIFFHYFT